MKNKKEFYLSVFLFLFILTVIDIAVIKGKLDYIRNNVVMNGNRYTEAGMMEYKNPNDGRTLYLPIYIKGDK